MENMNLYLFISSCLTFLLAILHSVLGELKIFRYFNNVQGLPVLQGIPLLWKKPEAAKLTIRMVWHVTTVLALAIGIILCNYSFIQTLNTTDIYVIKIIGGSMLVSCLVSLILTKGSHASWIAFLIIGVLCFVSIF